MTKDDFTRKLASIATDLASEPADAVAALMGAVAMILHPQLGPFGTVSVLRDILADAEAHAVASIGQQHGESAQ